MDVVLLGIPLTCGGANSESGYTALTWRKAGIDVTVAEFTGCSCGKPPILWSSDNPWQARLRDAGCSFAQIHPGNVRDFAGKACVAFCHSHALHHWPALAALGCKLIWSPCMCFTNPHERKAFRQVPPSAVHFQSAFQVKQTAEEYRVWGCERFRLIHGAFEPLPFRPRERKHDRPFVVGRLARACRTKWAPWLWQVLREVKWSGIDLEFLGMAWDDSLSSHCGPPPEWAECLPQDTVSPQEFLSSCHAMICPNWGVEENWPRVGLEAMSAGVPLLVDNQGGWPEMLGDAGILCNGPADYRAGLVRLATDEHYRRGLIQAGRRRVEEIANPREIGAQWGSLLESL